ncbi:MAG: hypothetical protein HZA22_10435 [Nitrospirae bacterium]|nr:hypothetical protein [Nitrospirota bacterium]
MLHTSRNLAMLVLSLMMAFASVSVSVSAGVAGADEAGAGPKRVIHGKPDDRAAVMALLDESEGDAEAWSTEKYIFKLKGKFKIDKDKPADEAALDFIDRHRSLFWFKEPKHELRLSDREPSADMSFQQSVNGVSVWGHSLCIHLDNDDEVYLIVNNTIPTPDIDTTPLITADEAVEIVKSKEPDMRDAPVYQQELVINENKLVYQVVLGGWRYFVDAKSGKSYWSTEAWDFRPIP